MTIQPEILLNFEVFSQLTQSKLKAVADKGEINEYDSNEVIFHQNDKAKEFFCLLEGRVELNFVFKDLQFKTDVKHEDYVIQSHEIIERPLTLEALEAGSMFGWSSMVSQNEYTATAQSITNSRVFVIDSLELKGILDADPEVGYVFMKQLADIIGKRLNRMTAKLAESWTEAFGVNNIY